MVSKPMLDALLQKQLTYQPERQPYFTFQDGKWNPVPPEVSLAHLTISPTGTLQNLRMISWNIDFMAPKSRARMASALSYLEQLLQTIPSSCATIIHLQEMVVEDLAAISQANWVQKLFNVTNVDALSHEAAYGQVTLVDRRLVISSVSRLPFVSEFGRDALCVDLCLDTQELSFLRVCNVHLDSLSGTLRPIQWKALQQHLQREESGVLASILAGDCNATRPRDRTEAQANGFKDAYLELGGVEGDEQGATWGFQSRGARRWGPQRLDKVVCWGAVAAEKLERIGMGVQVEDERARRELGEEEELTFVTDHYGLMGCFAIKDGLNTTAGTSCDG